MHLFARIPYRMPVGNWVSCKLATYTCRNEWIYSWNDQMLYGRVHYKSCWFLQRLPLDCNWNINEILIILLAICNRFSLNAIAFYFNFLLFFNYCLIAHFKTFITKERKWSLIDCLTKLHLEISCYKFDCFFADIIKTFIIYFPIFFFVIERFIN